MAGRLRVIEVTGPERGVAVVTIARPERKNALTLAGFRQLAEAWRELEAAPAVRVIVVTGAGGDFSAGADLGSIAADMSAAMADGTSGAQAFRDVNDAVLRNLRLATPVISAVEGVCYGAGMELVGATDIRIGGQSARFALPEVRHGLVASGGSLARLPRQIPYAAAIRLILTGQPAGAAYLERVGFLSEVVADGSALVGALEVARVVAANSPTAVRAAKRVVQGGILDSLEAAFALEEAVGREVLAGPDAAEGARAFTEKRPPVWRL
jgi:enoyl-CoA hydratase